MFCRYVLRTTDAPSARQFYAEALGLSLPDGAAPGSPLESWPLHERALAGGAPPHWLGQIAVDDVDATVARLVAAGSEPLGPTVRGSDGTPFATVRDPFGAVIGVRAHSGSVASPFAWHHLHVRDADAAWTLYRDLFGWHEQQTLDLDQPIGRQRLFAWAHGGPAVGAIGDSARRPGIHTHWLYGLRVADVDAAAARVRALGGTATPSLELPGAMRIAACEDPQGAAFGLIAQREPATQGVPGR